MSIPKENAEEIAKYATDLAAGYTDIRNAVMSGQTDDVAVSTVRTVLAQRRFDRAVARLIESDAGARR